MVTVIIVLYLHLQTMQINAVHSSLSDTMDTNSNNCCGNIVEDILTIKNSLIDISVELASIKKSLGNQQINVTESVVSIFRSKDEFINFNSEIESNKEKFDNFVKVLRNIFSNNRSEIQSDLAKFFYFILRACFDKTMIRELTWNKYKGKLAIGISRIFDAIQLSGLVVDNLSIEFDRRNILRKQFNKFKDAARLRKGNIKFFL